jgi:hypothetical protein
MKRPSPSSRGLTWAIRAAQSREEHEAFLLNEDEEEHADRDGLYPPNSCWTIDHPDPPDPHAHLPVYRTIHQYAKLLLK